MNMHVSKRPSGFSRNTMTTPPAPYDRLLLAVVIVIVSIGLMMVASASIVISEKQFHSGFHFFYHQLAYLSLGLTLGLIVIRFPIALWERFSGYLLLAAIFMLMLIFVPGIGRQVNGSYRWISLGFIGFQVSEFAKFAMVTFMAGYLVRRREEVQTSFTGFIKPMFILGIMGLLLLGEPDFGATVVITSTCLGMLFLGGVRLKPFIILMGLVLLAIGLLAVSAPYRLARITTFLHPWANQFNSGYQLTQSLIAFGRGGVFGVGLGKSIQKLFYLPEAHTDFLFAVLAEELGLIGVICVIVLFTLLVFRIFYIARKSQQLDRLFSAFLAYGFGIWLTMQFIVSIGVNCGLLPTKGLTLPLMSYGGSSIMIDCMAIAIVFRIDYENRMAEMGVK